MDYETQHFILVALHAGRGMAHAGMLVGREDTPTVPEEPKEIEPWFNPTDSLIALEVWKQAGGPGWRVKWDPQDIMTWLGTGWYVDEETKECRLWHLYINFPPDESVVGTLSPKLGELTELRCAFFPFPAHKSLVLSLQK